MKLVPAYLVIMKGEPDVVRTRDENVPDARRRVLLTVESSSCVVAVPVRLSTARAKLEPFSRLMVELLVGIRHTADPKRVAAIDG